jgi:hypothetical protein
MDGYMNEEQALDRKLEELLPKHDTDAVVVNNMTRDVWSSRIDSLTRKLREIDRAQLDSAARAWQKGVV